jgi:hypothetical protein
MNEQTFTEELQNAVQQSVLKMIRDGSLVVPEYAARAKVPAAKVQELYDSVNWSTVRGLVIEEIERAVADKILNQMATEMATDIKQILSNKELREDVRSFIRSGIRSVAARALPQGAPE